MGLWVRLPPPPLLNKAILRWPLCRSAGGTLKAVNKLEDLEVVEPLLHSNEIYIFPDDHRVGVTKSGEFFNLKTRKWLKQHPTKRGYLGFIITSPGKKATYYKSHRVIARTFIGRPSRHLDKPYSTLEVNHIDGNPVNNNTVNLEWVTCGENIEHAVANGLWSKISEVELLRISDRSVERVRSISALAKKLGLHKATVFKHLSSSEAGQRDYGGFAFRYKEDKPWVDKFKLSISRLAVLVVNNVDKTSSTFETLTEACNSTRLSYSMLYRSLVTKGNEFWDSDDKVWRVFLINS